METTGQERQINCFAREPQGVLPAVLCFVAGMLGLMAVAAGPWLLLG